VSILIRGSFGYIDRGLFHGGATHSNFNGVQPNLHGGGGYNLALRRELIRGRRNPSPFFPLNQAAVPF
jgi:hypothetical protein